MSHLTIIGTIGSGVGALALLAGLAGAPAEARHLSGGSSAGGAIQGGSGAPGSGVGIPGAIVHETTDTAIGSDGTRSVDNEPPVAPAPVTRTMFRKKAPLRHRHDV